MATKDDILKGVEEAGYSTVPPVAGDDAANSMTAAYETTGNGSRAVFSAAAAGQGRNTGELVDAHVKNTGVTPDTKEDPKDPPYHSYQQLWDVLNPEDVLTDDEKKRRKRDERLAVIGDALNAFSHAWYRQGAKEFDPLNNLSTANRERWDKIVREKIADNRARADAMTRARQLDMSQSAEERKWRNMLEQQAEASARANAKDAREEIRLEIAQAKADRDAAVAEVKLALMAKQIEAKDADARLKDIQAEYAKQHGMLMGRMSSVSYYGGGKKAEYRARDSKGNWHYFSKKDAAIMFATQEGTLEEYPVETTEERETTDGRRKKKETKTTTKVEKVPSGNQSKGGGLGWGKKDDEETDW